MSNLRTLLDNSKTVFTNMTVAERNKQVKALEYISFISSQAKVDLSNTDILKVFGDATAGINRLVLDPKEINKRIFEYQDSTKNAIKEERIAEFLKLIKSKKIKAKKLITELTQVTLEGFWKVIDIDASKVTLINNADLVLQYDGRKLNFGTLMCELYRKELQVRVHPFKNNLCGHDYNDETYHPYVFGQDGGAICYGNAGGYMATAKRSKNAANVLNLAAVILSSYNPQGGPVAKMSAFQQNQKWDHSDDIHDLAYELYKGDDKAEAAFMKKYEKANMSTAAIRYLEVPTAIVKLTKKELKNAVSAKPKSKKALTDFVDIYADDDEHDEEEDN